MSMIDLLYELRTKVEKEIRYVRWERLRMKKINRKKLLIFNLVLCVVAIVVNFIALLGEPIDIVERIIALVCMIVVFFYVFGNLLHCISEDKE